MIALHPVLIAYLFLFSLSTIAELYIDNLNKNHLKKYGHRVPAVFIGFIDTNEIEKTARYTAENIRFSCIQTVAGKIAFILIILLGLLPGLYSYLNSWNIYPAGLAFFGIISFASILFGLPFDYYHRFVLEDKYGFNTQTIWLWLADLVKSLILMAILGAILITVMLLLIQTSGSFWWIWAWIVFFSFQLLLTVIYPAFIAPLFNEFTPIEDTVLQERIEQLAEDEHINVKSIMSMDASKRTRHTNAYLSGLGRAKRIVLFDSLIETHSHEEIIAVLAHEIGHLKKHHIKKQLATISLSTLLLFYLASKLIVWENLFIGFGFTAMAPYTGLFLVGIIWGPVGYFLSPLGNIFSRRYEREADNYALGIMKTGAALIQALKKLAKDNLSNLYPHPAYVWFNYSHPPLLERIRHIEEQEEKKGGKGSRGKSG